MMDKNIHPLFHSNKISTNWKAVKHIWIDLQNTLFFTLPDNLKPPQELSSLIIIHSSEHKLNFFIRPAVFDFLLFCQYHFDSVNIWSSYKYEFTNWIISNIFNIPNLKFDYILYDEDIKICKKYFNEYKSIKYIEKMFSFMKKEKTLLLDDSFFIHSNKPQSYRIKTFNYHQFIDDVEDIISDKELEKLQNLITKENYNW